MMKRSPHRDKPYVQLKSHKPMKRGTKRLRAKPDSRMAAWSKAVKKRDGYQCQAPFVADGNFREGIEFLAIGCSDILDAHHIAERSLRPDLRFELNNGVTLCRSHHRWLPLHRAESIKLGLLSEETYESAMKNSRG